MADTEQDAAEHGATTPHDVEAVLVVVQFAELAPTYSVGDLLGRAVANDGGEEIGRLDDLMMQDDRLVFAVLSVGGFLGLGAHQVVVAFEDLLIDDEAVVLPGATKAALKQMCAYDRDEAERQRRPIRRRREPGEVVRTAMGEPVQGAISDLADGD